MNFFTHFLIITFIMLCTNAITMGCVFHNTVLFIIGFIGAVTSNILSYKELVDNYNKNNK